MFTFAVTVYRILIMSDNPFKIESANDLRNEIRSYMVRRGHTYSSVSKLLKDELGINITPQSLNNKLTRGSIRYIDVKNIAHVLGYKIKWE